MAKWREFKKKNFHVHSFARRRWGSFDKKGRRRRSRETLKRSWKALIARSSKSVVRETFDSTTRFLSRACFVSDKTRSSCSSDCLLLVYQNQELQQRRGRQLERRHRNVTKNTNLEFHVAFPTFWSRVSLHIHLPTFLENLESHQQSSQPFIVSVRRMEIIMAGFGWHRSCNRCWLKTRRP